VESSAGQPTTGSGPIAAFFLASKATHNNGAVQPLLQKEEPMLKLNASFSKKVPGTQQYSSEGFMASVEVELPDGLNEQQLKEKIHQTFQLVQASVESELHNSGTVIPATPLASAEATPIALASPDANAEKSGGASPRQLKYIMDLVRDTRYDTTYFLQQCGVKTVYELNRKQISTLIDLIKEQQGKAA